MSEQTIHPHANSQGQTVQAAVVHDFAAPPRYGQWRLPEPGAGQVRVKVRAAAISQLVRAQAAGRHYSSPARPPFVPGADGVGELPGGERVYFAFPQAPLGSMAQWTVIDRASCVPLPAGVDEVTAAAIANPGMSSWAALKFRAHFQPGENVLINGATGVSGRLAVQVARALGAGHIVATGRNPQILESLRALGADTLISVADPGEALTRPFQAALHDQQIDVVLDYLWGASAERLLAALALGGHAAEPRRVRYVQIGAASGPDLTLSAATLRSTRLELLGSGLGSNSGAQLLRAVAGLLEAAAAGQVTVEAETAPLSAVESVWPRDAGRRMVLLP